MSVIIVDYGMCNLGSVKRAFEECGANTFISDDPRDLAKASQIILPGVGSFSDAMKNIVAAGWDAAIKRHVLEQNVPLLGICLGMQLLADKGYEGGENMGLGLIAGEVTKLRDESGTNKIRIPHIGWNEIHPRRQDDLLENVEAATDFYFVHSYFFNVRNSEDILCSTRYGVEFPSIVRRAKVMGVQFHPEKSSRPGFQLIRNFLKIN